MNSAQPTAPTPCDSGVPRDQDAVNVLRRCEQRNAAADLDER